MENTAEIKNRQSSSVSDRFGLVIRRGAWLSQRRAENCHPEATKWPKDLSFKKEILRPFGAQNDKFKAAKIFGCLAHSQPSRLLHKFIALLIFAVFWGGIIGGMVGCTRQEKVPFGQAQEAQPAATQQVGGFTFSSVEDDGASSWQLKGDTADILDDKVELKNVNIESRTKDSRISMKAKKGTIKKNEDLGIFKEDVVFAYDDGTTLATNAVNWSFKKQVAKTDDAVFVKSGGLETKAKGAYLKKNTNEIYLTKDILMNASGGTTIECDGPLVMDYKKNIAVFNKGVSIENPKGKMTGRRMVVYFDPAKKAVKKVEAFGSVCLTRGNSVSTSDRAVYFSEEGRAVLTGHPTVFVDSQEARKLQKEQ